MFRHRPENRKDKRMYVTLPFQNTDYSDTLSPRALEKRRVAWKSKITTVLLKCFNDTLILKGLWLANHGHSGIF